MNYQRLIHRTVVTCLLGLVLLACATTNSINGLESRLQGDPACETDEQCRELEQAGQRLANECNAVPRDKRHYQGYEDDCGREHRAWEAARAALIDQFRQHPEKATKEGRDKPPLVVDAKNDGANHIGVTVSTPRECRVTRDGYILSGWSPCGVKGISDAKLALMVPGNVGGEPQRIVSAITDAKGHGSIDVSTLDVSSDEAPLTVVPPQGETRIVEVPLYGTAVRRPSRGDSGNASSAAWEQARQEQGARNAAALDDAENKIKTLEQTKELWGDGELNALASSGKVIDDAIKRLNDAQKPIDPQLDRLSSRWLKLTAGPGKRAIALKQQRERAADAARQAEQQRQAEAAARYATSPEGRLAACRERCGSAEYVCQRDCQFSSQYSSLSECEGARNCKPNRLACDAQCQK